MIGDAGGAEEEFGEFGGGFPVEVLEGFEGAGDEFRRDDGFGTGVERGAVEELAEGDEIRRGVAGGNGAGEKKFDDRGLGGGIDAFEGTDEADEFGRWVFPLMKFWEYGVDERLLALAVEATGEAAPEDVLLELDLLAGVGEAGGMEVPEVVDAGGIEFGTVAGAEEEAGEDK